MGRNWNVSRAGPPTSHHCWKPRPEENPEFQCPPSLEGLLCFPSIIPTHAPVCGLITGQGEDGKWKSLTWSVHTSHFWHGMSPKMPQGLTGTMFNMQQEHGDLNQPVKWDVSHKKCVWCVHEYTAVPALTWISIPVSSINTFPLQTFHPCPL